MCSEGLALERQVLIAQLHAVCAGPGQARVVGACPVPGPDWGLSELYTPGLGRLGTGATCCFVVAMAVAAPRGQQQVARFEQLVQVVDQKGFIVGQRAILEVESSPVEAVEVQPKQLQGMAAFQWALMAQAALWPL